MDNVLSSTGLADIINHLRRTRSHSICSSVFLDFIQFVSHTAGCFFVHRPIFRFFDKDLSCIGAKSGRIDIDTFTFLCYNMHDDTPVDVVLVGGTCAPLDGSPGGLFPLGRDKKKMFCGRFDRSRPTSILPHPAANVNMLRNNSNVSL